MASGTGRRRRDASRRRRQSRSSPPPRPSSPPSGQAATADRASDSVPFLHAARHGVRLDGSCRAERDHRPSPAGRERVRDGPGQHLRRHRPARWPRSSSTRRPSPSSWPGCGCSFRRRLSLTDPQQQQAVDGCAATTPRPCSRTLARRGLLRRQGRRGLRPDDRRRRGGPAEGARPAPSPGAIDKATEAGLRTDLAAKGGAAAGAEVASTAAVQQTLKLAGLLGRAGGRSVDRGAHRRAQQLQTDLGVEVTGTVDAATIAAVEKALEEATTPPSPSASATPSATASS